MEFFTNLDYQAYTLILYLVGVVLSFFISKKMMVSTTAESSSDPVLIMAIVLFSLLSYAGILGAFFTSYLELHSLTQVGDKSLPVVRVDTVRSNRATHHVEIRGDRFTLVSNTDKDSKFYFVAANYWEALQIWHTLHWAKKEAKESAVLDFLANSSGTKRDDIDTYIAENADKESE